MTDERSLEGGVLGPKERWSCWHERTPAACHRATSKANGPDQRSPLAPNGFSGSVR